MVSARPLLRLGLLLLAAGTQIGTCSSQAVLLDASGSGLVPLLERSLRNWKLQFSGERPAAHLPHRSDSRLGSRDRPAAPAVVLHSAPRSRWQSPGVGTRQRVRPLFGLDAGWQ